MPLMKSPLTTYREKKRQSLEALADVFGVHKTTIRYWEQKGVPPERCAEIEQATGIPRAKLRPDIFQSAGAK